MSLIRNISLFGSTLEPEVIAVNQRAITLGYTLPSNLNIFKINAFIKNLKLKGLFQKLDIMHLYASGGDANYATLNYVNPLLYQGTRVNNPTFTANVGFSFNGTNQYINTNFAPSQGVKLNDLYASYHVYNYDNGKVGTEFGAASDGSYSNSTFFQRQQVTGKMVGQIHNPTGGGWAVYEVYQTAGFFSFNRAGIWEQNPTAGFLYYNGVLYIENALGAGNTQGGVRTTQPIYVGALNVGGSPAFFSNNRIGFFAAGEILAIPTAPNVIPNQPYVDFNNSFVNYLNSL